MGHDISRITEYLYISAWPESQHVDEILSLNIRLILSMHWQRPAKSLRQPPIQLLWLPTFDTPITPIPLSTLVRGVDAALPVIREGKAVLSHCRYGVHRSVAMACCVLIGNGLSADEAMRLISASRDVADPYAGYIQKRIIMFEQHWQV